MKCYSKRHLKVQFIELKLLRVVKYPETQKKNGGYKVKSPDFQVDQKCQNNPMHGELFLRRKIIPDRYKDKLGEKGFMLQQLP